MAPAGRGRPRPPRASRRRALRVRSSGSPGPAPTRCTHALARRLARRFVAASMASSSARTASSPACQRQRPALEVEAGPERPPRPRIERLDPRPEALADPGQPPERRRQHRLDLGLDLAREDGRRALGADRDRHRVAVDDRGRDEIAAVEVVDDVDERAGRAADRRRPSVALGLAGRAVDERRAVGVARRQVARHELEPPLRRPGLDLGRRIARRRRRASPPSSSAAAAWRPPPRRRRRRRRGVRGDR